MENYYQKRISDETAELDELLKKNNTLSNLRLAAILASGILLYFVLGTSIYIAIGLILAILLGFYILVKHHEKTQNAKDLKQVLLSVLKNELEIVQGKKNQYSGGEEYADEKHSYSADLDVFGSYSLYHLINRAKTTGGKKALASSFLKTPKAEKIKEVQTAVKELASKDNWRQEFQASLYEVLGSNTEALIGLQDPPKISLEWLIKLYFVLKWLFVGSVIATFYFYGVTTGVSALFALIGFNWLLVGANRKKTEPYFKTIQGLSRDLVKYKVATELILKEDWESKPLKEAKANLPITGKNPIDEFQLISKTIDMKNNQFAAFFLYFFSPFDLVQLAKLRTWVKNNPDFFNRIFSTISEFEKLNSLATLSFNNPNWKFPDTNDNRPLNISVLAAGHALLPESVCNDYSLSAANRLTLITGSNMSGKSTFLRTLGSSILLAYAGAPVFAKKMTLTTGIRIHAYMRIKDSLEQNSSTFKAEIDRIKILLEAMETEPMALLLVDEMLRGTNSEDKLKGSIAFLERVVKSKTASALVATHDLRTTEMAGKYPDTVKNYYFEYDAKDGELTFDYELKLGICKSFNASELLRSVGLDV